MSRTVFPILQLGQGFMGRTHSDAAGRVAKFFKPPVDIVMHTVVGRKEENPKAFASQWGWRKYGTNWLKAVRSGDTSFVDIVTPNNMHAEMAIEALGARKHVLCEKPLSRTLAEGREMVEAADKAWRKHHAQAYVGFNYRHCPAVATARQLVQEGRIGQITRISAWYLQDWAKFDIPLVWRFVKGIAGSGALGDLGAHIIDMVRFVTGLEIAEVRGALMRTFITERSLPGGTAGGGIIDSGGAGQKKKGKVTVDDTVAFMASFVDTQAVATFEAARQATGNQNNNGFEINGTDGAIRFHFEDLNRLEYYNATSDPGVQGWAPIICTKKGVHPYAEAWWADAHMLGYDHTFVHQLYSILLALAGQDPIVPLATFRDAYQVQRVMEAVSTSAREKRPVKLSEIR